MKKIIVPVDFSACAYNAAKYAIKLSSLVNAKLTILYVNTPQLLATTMPMPVEQVYFESLPVPQVVHDKLKEIKQLLNTEPGLQFEILIKEGAIADEIVTLAQTKNADLVVMGTEGSEDAFDLLWGSNTSDLIGKRQVPVLVIPAGFSKTLENDPEFVFATDFENINDWDILDFYKSLAISLNAKITVFYVSEELDAEHLEFEKNRFELINTYFEGLKVNVIHSQKSDVVKAVEEFAEKSGASLITMISHQRGFLESLFHKSITKQMSLSTSIPFLAIPDVKMEANLASSTNYW